MLSIKPYFAHKILPLLSFQVSSFALPWLATVWFTYKYNLNAAGEFTFALALISPLCMLLASPSRNFILTVATALSLAMRSRLLLIVVGLFIVIGISAYFHQMLFFSSLFLFKMTELLFDVPISIAVYINDVKSLWKVNLYKWGVIGLFVLFGFFVENIEWLFFLCALTFFCVVWLNVSRENKKGNINQLIPLIKSSLPLGLSALIFSIHFNIPRYVIGGAEQKELLAIYSISSFLIMGAVVLVNIFVQAKLPKIKILMETQKSKFKRELLGLIFIALGIFIFIQLAHVPIFTHFFWQLHNNVQLASSAYSQLYTQIIWLAWGPIIFSLANYFLILSGQHKSLLLITAINIIFTYSLCFFAQGYGGTSLLLWAYNAGCVFQCIAIFMIFKTQRMQ